MKKVESYYDERSSEYDKVFDSFYFRIYDYITWKYLEPIVPRGSDVHILDAAGGTGRWSIRMAKKGCRVTLLDISDRMLKVAREKVVRQDLQHLIYVEKGDVRKLNYQDETFDMVLFEHALFLLEEPDAAIKEFARVLKKGASLVISALNRYVQSLVHIPCTEAPTSEKLDEVLGILVQNRYDAMARDRDVKIYTYTPDEFRNLLERNGFRVEKIIGKGFTMPLRIPEKPFMKKAYPEELYNKMIQIELYMCDRTDSLALAGHLQATAYKE